MTNIEHDNKYRGRLLGQFYPHLFDSTGTPLPGTMFVHRHGAEQIVDAFLQENGAPKPEMTFPELLGMLNREGEKLRREAQQKSKADDLKAARQKLGEVELRLGRERSDLQRAAKKLGLPNPGRGNDSDAWEREQFFNAVDELALRLDTEAVDQTASESLGESEEIVADLTERNMALQDQLRLSEEEIQRFRTELNESYARTRSLQSQLDDQREEHVRAMQSERDGHSMALRSAMERARMAQDEVMMLRRAASSGAASEPKRDDPLSRIAEDFDLAELLELGRKAAKLFGKD